MMFWARQAIAFAIGWMIGQYLCGNFVKPEPKFEAKPIVSQSTIERPSCQELNKGYPCLPR